MGPYDTEAQAAAEPMPRKVAALHATGKATAHTTYMEKLEALHEACTAAGVDIGGFDHRTLEWLAGWEPTTVQAIVGIISRAGQGRPVNPGS